MDKSEFTMARPFRRVLTTDATSTTLADLNATATKPSGDNVIDLLDGGLGWSTDGTMVPDQIEVVPYGSDAANENYHLRITGWSKFVEYGHASHRALWIPTHRVTLVCTLGARTITPLLADGFLADTITISVGNAAGAVLNSPINDYAASVTVKTFGAELLQFDWDLDAGGTASAAGNALIRPVNQKA